MMLIIGCDCDEQDDRGENFDSKFQNVTLQIPCLMYI